MFRKLFEEVSKEFSASVWKGFVQLIMAAIILRGRNSIGDFCTAAYRNDWSFQHLPSHFFTSTVVSRRR